MTVLGYDEAVRYHPEAVLGAVLHAVGGSVVIDLGELERHTIVPSVATITVETDPDRHVATVRLRPRRTLAAITEDLLAERLAHRTLDPHEVRQLATDLLDALGADPERLAP